jgi:hypothetical protein
MLPVAPAVITVPEPCVNPAAPYSTSNVDPTNEEILKLMLVGVFVVTVKDAGGHAGTAQVIVLPEVIPPV